jgi:hypothetical protein
MEIVVWILSVQLWTDPPPAIKFVYTKEFPTHEECMAARSEWEKTKFNSFCLMKVKKQ